jgi:D-amino-acid oxidase
MTEIVVIGSGVIGMTTALCLSKNGYEVTIISKDNYSQTTSAAAAALWLPFKAEPKDKVCTWAQKTLSAFKEQASIPEAGIVWHEFSEFLLPEADLPWWHTTIDSFRCDNELIDLPIGKRKVCHFSVPIIDTGLYLPYLQNCLQAARVKFLTADLTSISDAFAFGNIVINCSGIGAINLAKDQDLHPARGQIVRIKRQPHHLALVDLTLEPRIAHVMPRINDTVLGGTYEEGVFDLEPNKNEMAAIIKRCQDIFPALGNISQADILSSACGLRPVRSSVRVELEQFGTKQVFHNYGHGGSGFTLSWGCAEEIFALVSAAGIAPAFTTLQFNIVNKS